MRAVASAGEVLAFTEALPVLAPPETPRLPNFVGVVGVAICAMASVVKPRKMPGKHFMVGDYHEAVPGGKSCFRNAVRARQTPA